ncbi:hypothetical protein [Chryseobacterium caseinilyticum]|uniref:FecR protein domain-containing protein n=1 Tax=Chryseobacterium caseinilyticum TaxID=2771428 RepID=A0ABR8Z919_9FLAO|nr:hypothetical protein [Chryseobacterium caseinilyticum]MBD8081803.1 hypothetical protein [Chryseobacterium caseinilyticum]
MDKNIQKQLKTDYEELEIKPSANLWDQIESELDTGSETFRKHTFHWWKYAAVIVLLISVGGLFYFNTDKPLNNNTIITKNPSENNFRLTEAIESTIPNEEITKKSVFNKVDVINDHNKFVSEKSIEKIQTQINPEIIVKELKPIDTPVFALQTPQNINSKTNITEKKKTSYTTADELLLGRELDKTRVESSRSEQFGVVDASKLKIRRPGSLRIFGVKVFADSAATE